jgi:hypothetical protein
MSQKPYKRQQGDFELRILRDGRLVMVAPDETLMEIARTLEDNSADLGSQTQNSAFGVPSQLQHLENQNGQAAAPGRQ